MSIDDIGCEVDLRHLPKRAANLDFLAGETLDGGMKVTLSNGEQVSFQPPPAKPAIPDWSEIKSIRHYFHRKGFEPWPAWVYHPIEEARLLKNKEEGMDLGLVYRKTSAEEQAKTGLIAQWDWEPGCEWRPRPFPKDIKFDPSKTHQHNGKEIVYKAKSSMESQNELLNAVLPQVTSAVIAAMKASGVAGEAPKAINQNDWEEFQKFQAWKKSAEVATAAVAEVVASTELESDGSDEEDDVAYAKIADINKLTEDQEWILWREEAKRRGIKIDKRWSLSTLRETVEKALLADEPAA